VRAACGAIALHNVNLELWKSGNGNAAENPLADDLVVKGLGPGPLLFALHTLQKQGTRRAPLAFFLRLCDGLHGPPPKFKTPILYN